MKAPFSDDSGRPRSGLNRRSFLKQLGATGLVSAVPLRLAGTAAPSVPAFSDPVSLSAPVSPIHVNLTVNGARHSFDVEPRDVLLDVLRDALALTGTKKSCDHGQCGACTVIVNGRRINSCLTLAAMHDGDEITTIEGLEKHGELHPMQAAFLACDGFQCGYCTSGQIMSAVGLLHEPVGSSDAEVREAMSGNICRCGAYRHILAAVQSGRKSAAAL